jgi:predicted flap endonuclease-1-like 5' DNA nuclease
VTAPPDARADAVAEMPPFDMGLAAGDVTAEGPDPAGIVPDVLSHADQPLPEPDTEPAAAPGGPVDDAASPASEDSVAVANGGEARSDQGGNDAEGHEAATSERSAVEGPVPDATGAAAAAEPSPPGDSAPEDPQPSAAGRVETEAEPACEDAAEAAQGAPARAPDMSAPPPGDLPDIPGVGPGLVWMLQSAGVRSLEDLARAEAQDLAARLGSISRLLDLDYLIGFARDRAPR